MLLERIAPLIAVLDTRGTPEQALPGSCCLRSFAEEPLRFGGHTIVASRLIPVLQFSFEAVADGHNESDFGSESAEVLLALQPLNQSWEPRLVRLDDSRPRQR